MRKTSACSMPVKALPSLRACTGKPPRARLSGRTCSDGSRVSRARASSRRARSAGPGLPALAFRRQQEGTYPAEIQREFSIGDWRNALTNLGEVFALIGDRSGGITPNGEQVDRTADRRVGTVCCITCRFRWWLYQLKQK